MTSQTETLTILHRCADIEGVLAEIYEFFASAYRPNQEISQLFQKTASEERNHEYQLRLAMKAYSPLILEVKLTLEAADRHLSYAKEALQKVRETDPKIEDALKVSINLETIFNQFHIDAAACFTDESCARLFKAMMAADEGHVTSLEDALAGLGKN